MPKMYDLKQRRIYLSETKGIEDFLNLYYLIGAVHPFNIFEKLELLTTGIDRIVIAIIDSKTFILFTKGYESVEMRVNKKRYVVDKSELIYVQTNKFSISYAGNILLEDTKLVLQNETAKLSSFIYINIINMTSKHNPKQINELVKVVTSIETILQLYAYSTINYDLNYMIYRFDDPLQLVHFAIKLRDILEHCYITLGDKPERVNFSAGIAYGHYQRFRDFGGEMNKTYVGIAINKCARLAKIGYNEIYMCKGFTKLVKENLKYFKSVALFDGVRELKGFRSQPITKLM